MNNLFYYKKDYLNNKLPRLQNFILLMLGSMKEPKPFPRRLFLTVFLKHWKYRVPSDYLLNGTIQNSAENNIQDNELLLQFEKVEKLNIQKKSLVKEFLDAFTLKTNLQQQLS